ncbi:TonB-dependent receptor [Oceanobacter sp. 3_MG-2023]|uniref:TonB-dependent receptor n=1 Tax=Oceanobacter sp. 3_MG-2023 TaxID=3062622 RepID=UPI002732402E|nr:TonB-dependent receptor [Oceanobacter sp. 3_MG-2023]MDP2507049.1 TonB-dependent receptor [Oceanobacter sp. 3_MG-2023]
MKLLIKPLVASLALASATLVHADGIVEGRIIDAASQTIYKGAVVRLEEAKRQTLSGQSGRFRLPQVPAGEYTLTITLGDQTLDSRKITVTENTVTSTDVVVNDGDDMIDEVLVYGQSAQMQRALDRQRYSDRIISAVNADAIGELPDANAAEALQRIPGLSIERDQGEGRFVRVRGMGSDYNSVSVNGTQIPAPEAGTRSVALDVIPSNLISSLVVTKSLTPDMDANSIGGAIEIESISALDREGPFYNADLEYSYDELTENTNPKLSLGGGTTIAMDGDRRLGIAAAASYESRDFGSENTETGGAWDDGELEEMEMRDYTINRERIGAALNLDYEHDINNAFHLRTLYSKFTDDEQRQALIAEFQELVIEDGEEERDGTSRASGDSGLGEVSRELKDRKETQTIKSVTFGGEHFINDWTVEYDLGTSSAKEDEPDSMDSAVFTAEVDNIGFNGSRQPILFGSELYDTSNFELDEIERVRSYSSDDLNVAKIDITRDLIVADYPAMVKFGGKLKNRKKHMDVDIRKYSADDISLSDYTSGSTDYSLGNFGPSLSSSQLRSLMNTLAADADTEADAVAEGFVDSLIEDYTIEEDVNAAYVMGRIDMDQLQLIGGLRHEQTKQKSKGYEVNGDDNEANVSRTHFSNDYSHTLPSLLAKLDIAPDTQVRAAWTNSVVRPTFEMIRPNVAIDGDELEAGNPDLKPLESSNLDLGIEHFMGNAGVISAFAFYKSIDNFSYETEISDNDYYNSLAGEDDTTTTTFENGRTATVKGLELAYSQKFATLPAPFNGLLLSANVTFVDSKATIESDDGDEHLSRTISLPQQSDTTGNLMVGYENDTISLRLAANYKSDYLDEVGNLEDSSEDIKQSAQTQVDFNASYKVSEHIKVRFKAANLTDEPYYAYQGSERYNAQYEDYGPTYSLGLSYTSF